MKLIKKILKFIGILLLLCILFKGWLYRTSINYTSVGQRNTQLITSDKLIKLIDSNLPNENLNIDEVIVISSDLTCDLLSFSFNKVSNNPNHIFETSKANCIGYASLFNAIGNYIITKQNNQSKYQFNHLIGELDFFGKNLHSMFNSSYFKDHDFNEIIDLTSGEKTYVDLSVNDYFWIREVSSSSN